MDGGRVELGEGRKRFSLELVGLRDAVILGSCEPKGGMIGMGLFVELLFPACTGLEGNS